MVAVLLIGSFNYINAQGTKANVPTIKLNNGMEIPRVGIGTYAISYEQAKAACLEAFKNGFRHVDCATVCGIVR
jgi:aryl-alcohol dehydrogenase-like predicted oxidoreductase